MKRDRSFIGRLVGTARILGLLPGVLHAELKFFEQFKFGGGIVVALDFDDGKSSSELATDSPFLIHGLLSDDARSKCRTAPSYPPNP